MHTDTLHIDTLRDVLTAALDTTRVQARRADDASFKHDLRARAHTIETALAHLTVGDALDAGEAATVAEIVTWELDELRVEIRHTDTWSYKAALRARAEDLRNDLGALTAA